MSELGVPSILKWNSEWLRVRAHPNPNTATPLASAVANGCIAWYKLWRRSQEDACWCALLAREAGSGCHALLNDLQVWVDWHARPYAVQMPVLEADPAIDAIGFGEVYGDGEIARLQVRLPQGCDHICNAAWGRLLRWDFPR